MSPDVSAQLLLVEDDDATRRAVAANLTAHGYVVREAADGEAALRLWEQARPDLVLLDLGLPGIDGLGVTRRMRRDGATPIIVLSARDQERDKVAALDAGADDYIEKPFGIEELLARLRAVLRRAGPSGGPVLEIGELVVDLDKRSVAVSGRPVSLTPHEFELLRVLAQNEGKLMTHPAILREVWGPAYGEESHYLHVYISQLRRKIEDDPARPRYLLTEPGAGYRLVTP